MTGIELEIQNAYVRGWTFTPLHGKIPTLKGWQQLPRHTLNQAIEWAKKDNVGLRTGAISGIGVIDIDPGSEKGWRSFPATATVVTGRGGWHLYYRVDRPLANSVSKLAKGVDVRGDAGQVVFVGGDHPVTQHRYWWMRGRAPEDIAIAPFPWHLLPEAQTIAQKAAYVASQGQTRDHHCHWPGCTEQVPPAQWGCREHWYKLPKSLRDRIWSTYVPGQEINGTPSAAYLDVVRAVKDWIVSQLSVLTVPTHSKASAEERCMAYFATLPAAVSGSGGHNATFTAACVARRFGLDEAAMWRCMEWFNAHKCDPAWRQPDLAHKIKQAINKVDSEGRAGEMLRDDRPNIVGESWPTPAPAPQLEELESF